MPRVRGTTAAGARRRAQILEEAEQLVETIGFDELKMEMIADATGVAKSTLYHYFPQKDDMLFAIHEQTMTEQIDRLREIRKMDVSTAEQLRLAMTEQLRLIAEHPGRVRVLMDAKRDNDRPYRKEMAALERTYLNNLAELIETGVADGTVKDLNPVRAAEAMIGMTQHQRYIMKPQSSAKYEATAVELWQIFGSGLLADA